MRDIMKTQEKFDYLIEGYQKGILVYKAKMQADPDLKEVIIHLSQVYNGSKNEDGEFVLWTYKLLGN